MSTLPSIRYPRVTLNYERSPQTAQTISTEPPEGTNYSGNNFFAKDIFIPIEFLSTCCALRSTQRALFALRCWAT